MSFIDVIAAAASAGGGGCCCCCAAVIVVDDSEASSSIALSRRKSGMSDRITTGLDGTLVGDRWDRVDLPLLLLWRGGSDVPVGIGVASAANAAS